ncbi:MAG: FecR domain-containing protein [Spirochaetes bacterium]|nr:FecR domain-containing protein [Spirochaetota bacterium]
MRKKLIFLAVFLALAPALFAQSFAVVTFVNGWVDIRNNSGAEVEAFIGDNVFIGNSIITDRDSSAELRERASGSTFRISPNTVFAVREREVAGQRENVLAVAVGEVAFRVNRVAGHAPTIATHSSVAGVRGTEFTVFSGADGSSLIVVTEGAVDVEAFGRSVRLNPDEAVEVRAGQPPGERIQLMGRPIDFAAWNEGRREAFLNDPVGALRAVDRQLDYFNNRVRELYPRFLEILEEINKKRVEHGRILEEQGEEAANQFVNTILRPSMINSIHVHLNMRYYALSALSMRRFVVGNMYAEMKSRHIARLNDPVFMEFYKLYNEVLRKFEEITIPQISEIDI